MSQQQIRTKAIPASKRSCKPCRAQLVVRAQVAQLGNAYSARDIAVRHKIGEGSFGQVFEGVLTSSTGGDRRVVLKRVKDRVNGAKEMGYMEHMINVYASKAAASSCAHFVGSVEVAQHESKNGLSPGVWLMWSYEGQNTLQYYMKRRDCLQALARDMMIPVNKVVPTIAQQLLQNLQGFHAAGLVHRDVKPSNLVFSERDRRFKLIDLGAAADLRTGRNYSPDQMVLDPNYCPPERYVLPTESPDFGGKYAVFAQIISPMLWLQHKPDRFDIYSVGLVILQLAVSQLRTPGSLHKFHTTLDRSGGNLQRWRVICGLPPQAFEILDADAGAGWDLVQSLLRPRRVVLTGDGHVAFVNDNNEQRPSAKEALKHRFFRQAVRTVPASQAELAQLNEVSDVARPAFSGQPWSAEGLFSSIGNKLLDLEAQLRSAETATMQQSRIVERLERQVAAGTARPEELEAANSVLDGLLARFSQLQREVLSIAQDNGNGATGASQYDEQRQGWGSGIMQFVQSVSAGPSKFFKDIEEKTQKRKAAREQDKEFLRMLEEMEAAITTDASWESVYRRVRSDPRCAAVDDDSRRQSLFSTFQKALSMKRARRGEADSIAFETMLYEANLAPTTTYPAAVRRLRNDDRFKAVASEDVRQALFVAHMSKLQAAAGLTGTSSTTSTRNNNGNGANGNGSAARTRKIFLFGGNNGSNNGSSNGSSKNGTTKMSLNGNGNGSLNGANNGNGNGAGKAGRYGTTALEKRSW